MKWRSWAWVGMALAVGVLGCGKDREIERVTGQDDFLSAPPEGAASQSRNDFGGEASGSAAPNADSKTSGAGGGGQPRQVEETDLYRLEGDRLYFLNSYRGLMVFDVSEVDNPKLVGRSPISGSPVEMLVRNGIATIVVADWYGRMDDGSPFHGSIVRGLDATDPANIKVLGEAKLGGWVRDTRVVGDVLYAVSEDYGWVYGWDVAGVASESPDGVSNVVGGSRGPTLIVSSVNFANRQVKAVSSVTYKGYSGVFNVTANSILLAHEKDSNNSELTYLDISDPAGQIQKRGALQVKGHVNGWGADNGRWNLDFADGKTAHVIACVTGQYGYCAGQGYMLSIADFSAPDAPKLTSELNVSNTGWSVATRFTPDRLYLVPESWSYGTNQTPFQVYDLSNPAAPKLAGSAMLPGTVWNLLPAPNQRIFALGNDWSNQNGSTVSLKYIDVTTPSAPKLIGNSTFGEGWAWTPAAGTFKAFTMDANQGLVVLPFSGWSHKSGAYNNGLQLIEFTDASLRTGGAATTRGWVERGIFVKNRLVSLSDLSLSVVDYANHDAPKVVKELTLARNVVAARPNGDRITAISSDWWGNDTSKSEVRVLPIANAEEVTDDGAIQTANVEGVNAQVFHNGTLSYVVTDVQVPGKCEGGAGGKVDFGDSGGGCYSRQMQVQVVDTQGGAKLLRGTIRLASTPWSYWGWGWYGCYWYDWYWGSEVVQAGKDALAFRRWQPTYDSSGKFQGYEGKLQVVDLTNPDAPTVAELEINPDRYGWWGNMRSIGDKLYVSHYEWRSGFNPNERGYVRYFVDLIDLSDRAHPKVGARINVPGILVGGSDTDPSILYTMDYRWDGNRAWNDFDVVKVNGSRAKLLATVPLKGYTGQVFVRNNTAYLTLQTYDPAPSYRTHLSLHAIDLRNPSAPVDRAAATQKGWGWLLGIEGDRALITSGWGPAGLDIYKLTDGQAPAYSQFVRTRGWWAQSIARQSDTLFLSSGYWGVQAVELK